MATRPHGSPWMAFVLGGLLILVAIVAMLAYPNRANGPEVSQGGGIALRLPKTPPMPDGPKLPNPPIPTPK